MTSLVYKSCLSLSSGKRYNSSFLFKQNRYFSDDKSKKIIKNKAKLQNNEFNKIVVIVEKNNLSNRLKKFFFTKILTKEFFFSAFIIFLVGFLLRIFINVLFDIDVLKDFLHIVSISYFSFMALFSKFIKELFNYFNLKDLAHGNTMLTSLNRGANYAGTNPAPAGANLGVNPAGGNAGNNPAAGNAGVNPAAGNAGNNPAAGNAGVNPPVNWGNLQQPLAGRINSPIQVNDPSNQNYTYNINGTNQPLLGNIARALDHQRTLGLTSLSRYTFTPRQEQYILTYLLHNHPNLYNTLMVDQIGGVHGNPHLAGWWKQSNTQTFKDILINAL